MAGGNYTLQVWNEQGQQTHGVYRSPRGILVVVKKDWLSLYNPPRLGNQRQMEVRCGEIQYEDVTIVAVRDATYRDTLYLAVWTPEYLSPDHTLRGMAGVASNAFVEEIYEGIDLQQFQRLPQVLECSPGTRRYTSGYDIPQCFRQKAVSPLDAVEPEWLPEPHPLAYAEQEDDLGKTEE